MTVPSSAPGRTREPTVFSRPSETENQITRLFHAPRGRVYKIFTDAGTLRDALHNHPERVTVEKYDFRRGGEFVILIREDDGSTMRFWGVYEEIVPERRVVFTIQFSGWPGIRWVQTEEYEDVGIFTRLTVRYKFDTREHRDLMPGVGGHDGDPESTWNHVADLLGSP